MTVVITWQLAFRLISTILLGLFGVLTSYGAIKENSTRNVGIVMLLIILAGVIAIWI